VTQDASLWFASALLPGGWAQNVRLRIQDGSIVQVESGVPTGNDDERHAIGLPCLPNLHSHAFQRAIAGLTGVRGQDGDSFWSWRDVMYRFVARLEPDDVRAIASQAFVEMLESGFTRVGEFHYVHHGSDGRPYADIAELAAQVISAAAETGIGLTLLPVLYAHADFDGVPPRADQRRFVNRVDDFARLVESAERHAQRLPDARVGVAPHSLRAVGPTELAAVTALRPGAPVHIHVAEQVHEVEQCVAWSGQRPVAWLLEHANVDERWCLVHATHVDDVELGAMVHSGAVVGLCPITEADLGDGIFPAAPFVARGGRFGVGSDSNVSIDAAIELRTLEYGQRLTHRARNVMASGAGASTGRSLFDAAMLGGTQALSGRAVAQAGLAPGQSADLFSLDPGQPALVGRSGDALLDSWIFASGRDSIDRVWRRGRCVVRNGRHVAHEDVARRFAATVQRLLG
jgi:formiminoglutamate deiminase